MRSNRNRMIDVDQRITSLDRTLFDAVPSQTYPEDRSSLLILQRCMRRSGSYVYLEIGSHLGGTLQPHLLDSRCALIYSIDKRPFHQADESGGIRYYPENSTQRMLAGLQKAFPQFSTNKIRTFDSDAREVDPEAFVLRPDFCFIDGEHTDSAVFSDFGFCLRVCNPDGVVGFHDANVIVGGLAQIKRHLRERGICFQGFLLPKHVYVILLNDAVESYREEIRQAAIDESTYMRTASWGLLKTRISRRYPTLQKVWHLYRRLTAGASQRLTQ